MNQSKAIIYIRISDPKQRGNESLETQARDCIAYAEKIGATVIKVFREECESAKTTDRSELIKLLNFASENKGKINILIVWKVDRFARNQTDHFALKAKLKSYGIELHSATEPINDSPIGKAMEGMLSVFAEFDNEIRAQRALENMKTAFLSGRWMWVAPIGYINTTGEDNKGTISKDPLRFELIMKGLKSYSQGQMSIAKLTYLFGKWGLTTKEGNKIKQQAVSKMLRDKFYAGVMVANKWNLEIEGGYEPMISLEEFNINQTLVDKKGQYLKVEHLKDNPAFPLCDNLVCSECKQPMRHSTPKGRSKRYYYYVCVNNKCHKKGLVRDLNADTVLNAFVESIKLIKPRKKVLEMFKQLVWDTWKEENKDVEKIIEADNIKLSKLKAEKSKIYQLAKEGIFDDDVIRKDLLRVDNDIRELESKINLENKKELDIGTVLNNAIAYMENPYSLWENSDLEHKKLLQKAIFPNGFYYLGDGKIGTDFLSLPFSILRDIEKYDSIVVPQAGIEPASCP